MLTYNTQQERLTMPEHGRMVQKMVEYCMTLPDKAERNRCANAIIQSIITLNPEIKNSPEEIAKLWDHLAIISNFKLDIDYPHEVIVEQALHTRPEPVPYGCSNTRYRHYGHLTEVMLQQCASMDDSPERYEMIVDIANQMKKALVIALNDEVPDERIFNDIANMTHGAIILNPEEVKLQEYKHVPQPTGKKKKKK